MKIVIAGNKEKSSQNELLSVQRLDDNSQWLKSIVPPDMIDRKFFMSLYEELKDNSEFRELMESTKKLSLAESQQQSKSVVDSVYYSKLSKTNETFGKKFRQLETKLLDQVLSEVSHSYKDKQHTHSGFAYYLYYAWSNEMGICLRPDILFYTIACETMSYITKNKNLFNEFFSKEQREHLNINITGDLTEDKLVSVLNDLLGNKLFGASLTHTHFESQPSNFNTVLKFAPIKMATAYFNYLTSFCGITEVDVKGNESDWEILRNHVDLISSIVPGLEKYYKKCVYLIEKIIFFTFKSDDEQLKQKFFEEIFWLEDPCSSGHTHVVKGWFSDLYVNEYVSLEDFPAHANYAPYTNTETNKNYIKAVGMTYSEYENNILYPEYGEVVYEVLHQGIFKVLLASENVELSNEEKCKSMIKSINASVGYAPTDDEVDKIYADKMKLSKHKVDESFVGRFFETMTYATMATKVMKDNWKTTMAVTMLAGAVGFGAMFASRLAKN